MNYSAAVAKLSPVIESEAISVIQRHIGTTQNVLLDALVFTAFAIGSLGSILAIITIVRAQGFWFFHRTALIQLLLIYSLSGLELLLHPIVMKVERNFVVVNTSAIGQYVPPSIVFQTFLIVVGFSLVEISLVSMCHYVCTCMRQYSWIVTKKFFVISGGLALLVGIIGLIFSTNPFLIHLTIRGMNCTVIYTQGIEFLCVVLGFFTIATMYLAAGVYFYFELRRACYEQPPSYRRRKDQRLMEFLEVLFVLGCIYACFPLAVLISSYFIEKPESRLQLSNTFLFGISVQPLFFAIVTISTCSRWQWQIRCPWSEPRRQWALESEQYIRRREELLGVQRF